LGQLLSALLLVVGQDYDGSLTLVEAGEALGKATHPEHVERVRRLEGAVQVPFF
jgi:hypothetical protein